MANQCDGCKFYMPRGSGSTLVHECRVDSPLALGKTGVWPTVLATDWCGKWAAIGTTMSATAGREYQEVERRA